MVYFDRDGDLEAVDLVDEHVSKVSGHLFGTGFIGIRLESFNSEVLSREIGVNGFSDGCELITEY